MLDITIVAYHYNNYERKFKNIKAAIIAINMHENFHEVFKDMCIVSLTDATTLKLESKSLFFVTPSFEKSQCVTVHRTCTPYNIHIFTLLALCQSLFHDIRSDSHTTSKCSHTDRQMCLFIHEK